MDFGNLRFIENNENILFIRSPGVGKTHLATNIGIEAAIEYMKSQLIKLNENSKIEEEKKALKPTKPPLELANIKESVVNKYSFVQIENNFYSVPEYLVGFTVTSKIYYNKILIYSNNEFVCDHKKIDGIKKISANIRHYLKTHLPSNLELWKTHTF